MDLNCPYYSRCGGCNLKKMSYKKELEYKNKYVRELYDFLNLTVNDCIGMDDPSYYRYKTINTYGSIGKKTIAGIYTENSHQIIDIDSCLIQNKIANKIFFSLKKIIKDLKIIPYNEDKRVGYLRHVLIRVGYYTKEAMVVLVTPSAILPARSEIIRRLLAENTEIKTIVQNINSRNTSIVLGDKTEILYGPGKINDKLLGYTFDISYKSFYQVNPIQTEILYQKAISLAELNGNEIVLDTYSGIGTISLALAKFVKEVYAVEIVKDAYLDSIRNAKNNKIKNVKFFLDDASKWMEKYVGSNGKVDVLFMDPPRKGADTRFLDAVCKLMPKKIIYISCNPTTQVRDIKYLLKKSKYKVISVNPVDMFPHTTHVECVVLLSKVQN